MKKSLILTEKGFTKQSETSRKTIPSGMKLILMMMVMGLSLTNAFAQADIRIVGGSLTPFYTCEGTASPYQTFFVSAFDLADGIDITPPSGFEISLTSGGTYQNTPLTLAEGGGNLGSTEIFVRLEATASGIYSPANITAESIGALTKNVSVEGSAVCLSVAVLSQTDVLCFGGATGSATVSASDGAGGYTYSWTGGGSTDTKSDLTAGTYVATVTDALSATASHTFTIAEPGPILAVPELQTNVLCFGGNTGSVTVTASGGTGSYNYSWSAGSTTATQSALAAGTYVVTVTDANTCTGIQTFTITQPASALAAGSAGQTSVSCNGGSNGTATVSATGGTPGYTYSWSNGGTTALKTGLAAGTYTATVTDANLCTSQQIFTITQPTALSVSNSTQVNPCSGGNSGSASVIVTGGTPTYSYLWNGGGTSATNSGLAVGSYTVTITDANTCTTTKTFSLVAATTYTYTGTGAWTVTGNWSPCYPGTTIPDGSNVIISVGSTVTIPTGTIVINNGAILNDGNITVSGGTFTNNGDYGGIGAFTGAIFTNPPAGLFAPGD